MNYGNKNIDYALRVGLVDAVEGDDYAELKKPSYARKRSMKAMRKRGKARSGSTPGCGIGARSNRRYSI